MLPRVLPFAADLWRHRALLWQFTLRNVELRHKGSHLGLVWSLLGPLLMLGLYVVVFGYIMKGSFRVRATETPAEYALGVFFGLTLFHFVSEVLNISPTVVVANPNFVKKVVFPLQILPASWVGVAGIHMLISLALAVVGVALVGPGLDAHLLWLPVVLVPLILLALGLAWFFAALGVFFRDVNQVMQFLSMALMFASAVFYPASKIIEASPTAWSILRFNPVLLAIELSRDAVLWSRPLNLTHLAYLYVAGLAACWLGHAAFRRMQPAFADVL